MAKNRNLLITEKVESNTGEMKNQVTNIKLENTALALMKLQEWRVLKKMFSSKDLTLLETSQMGVWRQTFKLLEASGGISPPKAVKKGSL